MDNIVIKHIRNICKYHRNVGTVYKLDEIVPVGMCSTAFAFCYPYCLALLYNAEFSWMKQTEPNAVYAQCPASKVVIKIFRSVLDDPKLKNEWVNKITMKVVEVRNKQGCNVCYRRCDNMLHGSEFEFPKGDIPVFCPAAFNQIFPYIFAIENGTTNLLKNGPMIIECPDHRTRVRFEISLGNYNE